MDAHTNPYAKTTMTSNFDTSSEGSPDNPAQKSSVSKTSQQEWSQTMYDVMTLRKMSSETIVMPHRSVVALSSRGSLLATGCFDDSIVGRLRLWESCGALGVLLIILRGKVISPLRSVAEL